MNKIVDVINAITDRYDENRERITDCCGDHELFAELEARMDEERVILDMLIPFEQDEIEETKKQRGEPRKEWNFNWSK